MAEFVTPKRRKGTHKGDNGRILVVGGSQQYVGAPVLAAIAALRSGCDWVVLAAPERVAWAANAYSPDLMTVKLAGKKLLARHYPTILEQRFDVLVMGDGAGVSPGTRALMKRLAGLPVPKVIDADAVKAISAKDPVNAIVTPNKHEFALFLSASQVPYTEDPKLLRKWLKHFFERGNVLLVKGPTAIIIDKDKTVLNKMPNPGMTKAGTGDVLAGLCGGYLAQLRDPFQAAVNASIITGNLSTALERKKGYTYLASDLAEELKKAKRL